MSALQNGIIGNLPWPDAGMGGYFKPEMRICRENPDPF